VLFWIAPLSRALTFTGVSVHLPSTCTVPGHRLCD